MKTMNYNSYPDFQENQILSHNDLNSSFKYLNEQGLLTRANLIGTGIVCGLHASFKDGKVFISNGYGITSHGYYIKKGIFSSSSCECDAAEIDTVISSSVEEFGYVRKVECNYLKSFLKNDDTGDGNVYELLMKGKPEEEITKLFQDVDPLQKYSVFLLYGEKVNGQACNSCGGYKGLEKTITIRQFLVPLKEKSSGKEIPSLPLIDRIAQRLVELPGGDLKKIAESLKRNINTCYKHELLNEILNNNDYSTAIKKFNPDDFQTAKLNHYNFLCDLTEAYEEFRQYGEKVLLDYRLSTEEFPCHLILNGKYRHRFRPATASDDYEELNWLWKRLVTMIDSFDSNVKPDTNNSIRLTPSVYGAVPLSEKAVPYYYGKTMPYDVWSKREKPLGYWYDKDENVPDGGYYNRDNWNKYDLERYNFVRIEGHINVNIESSLGNITPTVSSCELPVSVIKIPFDGNTSFVSHKENFFNTLLSQAKKDFEGILFWNSQDDNNLSLATRAKAAKAAADAAKTAADTAKAAADAAKTAADATPPVIETVKEKAADAANKASDVKGNTTLISIAQTAADAAKTAADAAKTAANATPPGIETVKAKAAEAAEEATKAAEAAAKAAEAAAAILEIEKVGNSLKVYVDSFISSVKINYEKVISFACDNTKECIKLIVFADWMTDTCQVYNINKAFSSFESFRAQHPGLQHKSGVPIGGTFILVYDEKNTVIADFCLPYRVTQPD